MNNTAIIQGSSAGPLLYILFSNDIIRLFKYCKCILYADDLALTCCADNLNDLEHMINYDLAELEEYCRHFKLLINKIKTKYLLFNNRDLNPITLRIGDCTLERVRTFKYLGIIIDQNLTFADHINFLLSRLSQISGVVFHISWNFDFQAAILFYNAYVFSIMNYGIEVWGGRLLTYKCNELNNVIDRIIKNLMTTDVDHIRSELKLMRPTTLYKFRVLLMHYKIQFCGFLPTINFHERRVNYALRQGADLVVPFPKNNRTKMSYHYNVTGLWNQLTVGIKSSPTFESFKSKLKEYFHLTEL